MLHRMGRACRTSLVLFVFAIAIFLITHARGRVLYVDDDNSGDPEMDGSEDHPFDRIQRAVDNATAGDHIRIKTGSYEESIVLNITVFLDGEYTDSVVVDPVSGDGITVLAEGAEVRNLTVRSARTGIDVRAADVTVENISAEDCRVGIIMDGAEGSAIRIEVSGSETGLKVVADGCTIDGVTIRNGEYGIYAYDINRLIARNVTISGCSEDGMYLSDINLSRILNLTSSDNSGAGVYLFRGHNNTLENATLRSNSVGMMVYKSTDNVIRSVSAISNANEGISIQVNSDRNLLSRVNASDNRKGFYISTNCLKNSIDYSTIMNNDEIGIGIEGNSHDNVLARTHISGNDVNLNLRNSDGTVIERLAFAGSTDFDLYIEDSREVKVFNTTFDPDRPITLKQTSRATLYNCSFSEYDVKSGCTLTVKNWLHVHVITSPPSSLGIRDADARVYDTTSHEVIYSTSHYGGTDSRTAKGGWIRFILATYRVIEGAAVRNHTINVSVFYYGWEETRNVILNVTKTETFVYPVTVNYGDVLLETDQEWENKTVIVFGNLTLNASLVLRSAKVYLSENWTVGIRLLQGANLEMYDNDGNASTMDDASYIGPLVENITGHAENLSFRPITFQVDRGASFKAVNSVISGVGFAEQAPRRMGIYVETDDFDLMNSSISACAWGLVLVNTTIASVVNSSFVNCTGGVLIQNSTAHLEGISVEETSTGISLSNESILFIQNSTIDVMGVGIHSSGTNSVIARNITIIGAEVGIDLIYGGNLRLERSHITRSNVSVSIRSGDGDVLLLGDRFDNNRIGLLISDFSGNLSVSETSFSDNEFGVNAELATGTHIIQNSIFKNGTVGLLLNHTFGMSLLNLSLSALDIGISLTTSQNINLSRLELVSIANHVRIDGGSEIRIERSMMRKGDHPLVTALNINASEHVSVVNVTFFRIDYGIQTAGSNDIQIRDCMLQGGVLGINSTTEDILIKNCTFDSMVYAGILSLGTGRIIGSTFSGSPLGAVVKSSVVRGNTFSDCDVGIRVQGRGSRLFENVFMNGDTGIYLDDTRLNTVYGNQISGFLRGIRIRRSTGNTFASNVIDKEDDAFGLFIDPDALYNWIAHNNTVNDDKVYVYVNETGFKVSLEIEEHNITNLGQMVVINSNAFEVQLSSFSNGVSGIYVHSSTEGAIIRSSFYRNVVGVVINASSDISLRYDSIYDCKIGVLVVRSTGITFSIDGLVKNNDVGMVFDGALGCRVQDAIRFESNDAGIRVMGSTEELMIRGTLTKRVVMASNRIGIEIRNSSDIEIYNTTANDFEFGVFVESSSDIYMAQIGLADGVLAAAVYNSTSVHILNSRHGEGDYGIYGNVLGIVSENSTHVRLRQIHVELNEQPILMRHTTNSSLRRVQVTGSEYGMYISRSSHIRVLSSTFSDLPLGIKADHVQYLNISGSLFRNVSAVGSIRDSAYLDVYETRIEDSTVGLTVEHSSHLNVNGNIISYDEVSRYVGRMYGDVALYLNDSSDIAVSKNEIAHYMTGISAFNSRNMMLRQNIIRNITGSAFAVFESLNVSVKVNQVFNSMVGLEVQNSTTQIRENLFSGCENYAIFCISSTSFVWANTITDAEDAAIILRGGFANITYNEIQDTPAGVDMYSAEAELSNNALYRCQVAISALNSLVSIWDLKGDDLDSAIIAIGSSLRDRHSNYIADKTAVVLEGSTYNGSEIKIRSYDTGLHASESTVEFSGFIHGSTSVLANRSTVRFIDTNMTADVGAVLEDSISYIWSTRVSDSHLGISVMRGSIDARDLNLQSNSEGLRAINATVLNMSLLRVRDNVIGVNITGSRDLWILNSVFSGNGVDLRLVDCGDVTATNVSFLSYEFINTVVSVRNFLRIRVRTFWRGTPLSGVDVQVMEDDEVIYASEHFNGTDPKTDERGMSPPILVTDRIYRADGVDRVMTVVRLFKMNWYFEDLGINMSSSHTELYYYFEKVAYDMMLVSGDNQTGVINTTLTRPLVVSVWERSEREMPTGVTVEESPVEGVKIKFELHLPADLNCGFDPQIAITNASGMAETYVTLPDVAANMTIRAYILIDPIKNVTFQIWSVELSPTLMVSPSMPEEGQRVRIEISSDPEAHLYYLDFGDGSSTGWTEFTQFEHTYSQGRYVISLIAMDENGRTTEPVSRVITVAPRREGNGRQVVRTEIPDFIIYTIILLVLLLLAVSVRLIRPEVAEELKMAVSGLKRPPKKEVVFKEEPSVEEAVHEVVEKEEVPGRVERVETLEDLILELERHKRSGRRRKFKIRSKRGDEGEK